MSSTQIGSCLRSLPLLEYARSLFRYWNIVAKAYGTSTGFLLGRLFGQLTPSLENGRVGEIRALHSGRVPALEGGRVGCALCSSLEPYGLLAQSSICWIAVGLAAWLFFVRVVWLARSVIPRRQ
jgi:hypothetical protein